MATRITLETRFPVCGAPSAHPGEIMIKSPVAVMPCHIPTGLTTPKPPTKPPNLLFQVKIPSTLPPQMNPPK
eukprot:14301243-Ditylum_brightwellii.AAC.1